MSDTNATGEPARRRMTRCPEGHIFDAATHDACPTCGARPQRGLAGPPSAADDDESDTGGDGSGERRRDVPSPPGWLRPALLGGGALVVALIVFVMLRGTPAGTSSGTPSGNPSGTQSRTPNEEPTVVADENGEERTDAVPAERWQTVMAIGGRQFICVNETRPDGRYRLGNGCPFPFAGETGTTTIKPDGSWTSRADNGRVDSGTIEMVNEDKFIAHTRGGPVVWERVNP